MSHLDTIVALATPQGQGGIGIIRISGLLVSNISHTLLKILPYPRKATYLPLYDHNQKILDNIIAIFFPKPHSFTGEDVLEIHGHGGPVILEIIIKNILNIPLKKIRIALPGEFSERAFMNNKIDLIQAEAIADLINAKSDQAAKLASSTLQGNFSKKINKLEQELSNLRIYVESNIDFPEDKIQILNFNEIKKQIENIIDKIKKIQKSTQENTLIQNGIKIVITGKPNSGKSSLFNRLSERETAIVTPISGTTRDTLHEFIQLNGILINIVDTAGLKEKHTKNKKQTDKIEKIGIQRAWKEIKQANHILLVIDASTTPNIECQQLQLKIQQQLPKNNTIPITIIQNKADLIKKKINIKYINKEQTIITISAKYNQGIDLIKKHLKNNIKFLNNNTDENFIAHQRHIEAIKLSYQHLLQAKKIIKNYFINQEEQENEILAEELRYAHIELSKITGKFNSNKLIKKIFSSFCIGK